MHVVYFILFKYLLKYLFWIGKKEFFKKSTIKFLTPRHLPSRSNISTTVTQNHMRLEPMKTRHQNFLDTNFEEIQVAKDLQTV